MLSILPGSRLVAHGVLFDSGESSMKTLSIVIVASAGLVLSGCARSATTSANRSAGPQNSTPSAPSGPVTVSPAAHGVIGAGTVLMIRALEPISIRDEAGKT